MVFSEAIYLVHCDVFIDNRVSSRNKHSKLGLSYIPTPPEKQPSFTGFQPGPAFNGFLMQIYRPALIKHFCSMYFVDYESF